ncbi:MAG: transpeptidase family protein [Bacteroidales bacterium]|jgi:cell division protein FtsI (penicillin-binding protein 3)|nr:transpeptidase family protein [Bacteroidales bacterium]
MEKDKKQIMLRIYLIYGILFLLFMVVIGRVLYIQIVDGAFWEALSKERYEEMRPVKAKRGNIYSLDADTGELLVLATDLPKYDIYIDLGYYTIDKDKKTNQAIKERLIPDSIYNKEMPKLCDSLSKLFKDSKNAKTKAQYMSHFKKYRDRETANRYVLVQKDITLDQLARVKKFPLISKEKKKRDKATGKLIGTGKFYITNYVTIEERNVRFYPYSTMARRTIGVCVNDSLNTYDGIDGYYADYLSGEKGLRRERKIVRNTWAPIDEGEQIKAVDGKDVVTTLDVQLQELAENSLRKCLDSNDAKSGCVILMEVKTGHIKAIASLRQNSDGNYIESINTAISDMYESGSTFKTVSSMLYLDKGLIDTTTIVPTFEKNFEGAKTPIRDVGRINHGNVTYERAFEMSSNVGISQVVFDNYISKGKRMQFGKDLKNYFYFDKLNMDIKIDEHKPYINEKETSVDAILRLSFGYVTMISPMQLLTFYNAIANNGVMVKPMFVQSIVKEGKIIKEFPTVVLKEKICDIKTIHILQDMLERVVERGTGRKLSKTSYGIAGKTGTAEIGYSRRGVVALQHRASFAGYFPAKNPQYSCIVVISEPQKNATHGGDLAAPVFRDLSDRVVGTRITYNQISQNNNKQMPIMQNGNIDSYNKFCNNLGFKTKKSDNNYKTKQQNNTIPNVIGMTIRDAVYLLEKKGLVVSFEGKGKVIAQSLMPNQTFKKGNTIVLKLN